MGLKLEDLFKVKGTILLSGETGTGKSHLAAQIHSFSERKGRPFLVVNMATLVEEILESELFGHIKGSFTGANQNKVGFAERVGEGTLFLDEIGELTLKGQKKLLTLLEEKKYIPVGDTTSREFKGRIVAATNKNLEELVHLGKFREDLYFRLRVFSYCLEPICKRPEKLKYFIDFFFNFYRVMLGKENLKLSEECWTILLEYSWPGNVREIKNALEYIVSLASEQYTRPSDVPDWIFRGQEGDAIGRNEGRVNPEMIIAPEGLPLNYSSALEIFEENFLNFVLKKYHGQINLTANQIQISKSTLIAKARKYGINTLLLRAQNYQNGLGKIS